MKIEKLIALLVIPVAAFASACVGARDDGPVGRASAAEEGYVTITYPTVEVDIAEDGKSCFQEGDHTVCLAGPEVASELASQSCAVTSPDECGPNGCNTCSVIDEPTIAARVSTECWEEDCNNCGRYCNPCFCTSTL